MKHDSKFAVSDHGGMTKQLFNDLLTEHIGQWLLKHGRPGPKVVLIDGDGSHEPQLQTIQWLVDHDIHLFRLPAHLTHRLCPLDVSVFGPLKAYYRRILRQELRKGKIHVDVADRWRYMDEALLEVAPRTVSRGWQKAGLYPFNENIWKEEGWAETSAALTPNPTPTRPAARRSRRLQQEELGRYLLSKSPSVEEKDERIRQYMQEYPSEHDILQAALPQAPALQGTRRRGRLENAETAWLTSEAAIERVKDKKAKAAEEQQKALRRAEIKETQAKMKRLVQTAEQTFARQTAGDSPESPATRGQIDGLQAARGMALETVRVYEEQGVGKMCAKKAKRLASLVDKRLESIEAQGNRGSAADGRAPLRPIRHPDDDVQDENRDPRRSVGTKNSSRGRKRPFSSDGAASAAEGKQSDAGGVLASIRSLLPWRF